MSERVDHAAEAEKIMAEVNDPLPLDLMDDTSRWVYDATMREAVDQGGAGAVSEGLVEKMAEAMRVADAESDVYPEIPIVPWAEWSHEYGKDLYRRMARVALAVVEESLGWEYGVGVLWADGSVTDVESSMVRPTGEQLASWIRESYDPDVPGDEPVPLVVVRCHAASAWEKASDA